MEGLLRSIFDHILDLIRFIFDYPCYTWMTISEVLSLLVKAIRPRARKSLDNENILVTGVAAGIGKEAVIQLAKISTKATFILWDINEKGLLETSEECRKLGVNVYPYVVDLSQRENVIQAAARVRQEVGNITILINNAGLIKFDSFLEADPIIEQKILDVNLHSYMWIIREFLPEMIKRGRGHIVSTCSGLAYIRFRYLTSYVASKHGLKGFLDCLRLEMSLHPDKPDIKFSTIYPGWVKTAMTTGVTWEPRYKTLGITKQMDSDYVAREMVDGILKEKEHVLIPGSLAYLRIFYGMITSRLMDRYENFAFRDIKIQNSATNSTLETSQPTLVSPKNNNMTPCHGNNYSVSPQTSVLMSKC